MRLKPLTIGHLALLWDADCPFLTLDPNGVRKSDLIYAVGVCAQAYEPPGARKGFFERLSFELATWKWGRAIKRITDLKPEFEAFWDYLQFHRAYPDIEPAKGETRTLNSPAEWRMIVLLMEKFHLTWEQVMQTEVLRAHALWTARGDSEGWIKVANNDPVHRRRVRDFYDWAKEEDDKFFAAQPGGNN